MRKFFERDSRERNMRRSEMDLHKMYTHKWKYGEFVGTIAMQLNCLGREFEGRNIAKVEGMLYNYSEGPLAEITILKGDISPDQMEKIRFVLGASFRSHCYAEEDDGYYDKYPLGNEMVMFEPTERLNAEALRGITKDLDDVFHHPERIAAKMAEAEAKKMAEAETNKMAEAAAPAVNMQ